MRARDTTPAATGLMHRSFPKPTPRLTDKRRKRADKALAWRTICALVDARDGYRCRVCRRRVIRTLTLCLERAEHHHLIPRSQSKALQFDARNIILVCAEHHGQLTRRELLLDGIVHSFTAIDGRQYVNAEGPLTFREVP